MPSHKRARGEDVSGGPACVAQEHEAHLASSSPCEGVRSSEGDEGHKTAHLPFGYFIWNEVGMVLYARMAHLLHGACVQLTRSLWPGQPETQDGTRAEDAATHVLGQLDADLHRVWHVAKQHLSEQERTNYDGCVQSYIAHLLRALRRTVHKVLTPQTTSDTASAVNRGSRHATLIALCKALLQLCEHSGFAEETAETQVGGWYCATPAVSVDDDDDESGNAVSSNGDIGLHDIVRELRQSEDTTCYSYHARASMTVPCLPRFEGDKRLWGNEEEENNNDDAGGAAAGAAQPTLPQRPPRVGYTVELPLPHPSPHINTSVQLIEPRKRKPILDEYRVFSHPKKAAAHGADDFLVDEELLYRSLVVLRQHLDVFGSLAHASPFVRTLCWNLLDRDASAVHSLLRLSEDDGAGEGLHHTTTTATTGSSASGKAKFTFSRRRRRVPQAASSTTLARPTPPRPLRALRTTVEEYYAAFCRSRHAARATAQELEWYSVSAQWRDQALQRLAQLEDQDWYALTEVPRMGGAAIFPNYSRAAAVRGLALGLLRKLDQRYLSDTQDKQPKQSASGAATSWRSVQHVVEAVLLPLLTGEEVPTLSPYCFDASGYRGPQSAPWLHTQRRLRAFFEGRHASVRKHARRATHAQTLCCFLTPPFVFALQCLAELLELCSLASFSAVGIDGFTRSFVVANWEDEAGILFYLLKREPTNTALAAFVALPRLYKDLLTGVQLLAQDKMLPVVVEARRQAGSSALVDLHVKSHLYWSALNSVLDEEERGDELLVLSVATSDPPGVQPQPRWFSEACLERAAKVWAEDVEDFMADEAKCGDSDERLTRAIDQPVQQQQQQQPS